jgi:para-nitrobenzyl esterase
MGYYYQVTSNYASDTDACESPAAMAYELPMDDFVYVKVTGIENPDAASLTNVYPNPAQDRVTVSSSVEMTHLTITNYVGQVVYTSDVVGTSVELNTNSYQAGVYLVKIDTNNGVVTKHLIISR